MTRVAWFHCFAGTAGDMTLGALVHAGADPIEIAAIVGGADARRLRAVVRARPALRHRRHPCDRRRRRPRARGRATTDGPRTARPPRSTTHEHDGARLTPTRGATTSSIVPHRTPHRPYRTSARCSTTPTFPQRVRDRAQRTFRVLAEVEGRMHAMDPDDVEFHEVGAVDAIVDVVGSCAALEVARHRPDRLQPDHRRRRGACTPPTASCPNPAPAVVELLARRTGAEPWHRRPPRAGDADRRRADGRARRRVRADAGDDGRVGRLRRRHPRHRGSAERRPGRRRRRRSTSIDPGAGQPVELLECNVDDVTGEVIAHTIDALLARRRARRVGDADRHEEGSSRAHRARAGRPVALRVQCAT